MKNNTLQGSEMESWDLLFFVEIKAMQNAMGKRGYDQGCYADKNESGKQSVARGKYFGGG